MLEFILLSGLLFHASHAYPTGAPLQACENMTPMHSDNQPKPEKAPVQIKVEVKPSDNQRESELLVELTSPAGNSPGFKGFLCEVRAESSNKIIGQWDSSSPDVKFVDCDGPKSAATHTNNNQKKQVSLKWKGTTETGNVYIMYTIVESYPIFWVQQKSEIIDIRKPGTYNIPNTGAASSDNNGTSNGSSESGQNKPMVPGQPNPFGPQSGQPNQPGQQPGQPNPFGPQSGQPNQPGQQPGQPNPFGSQPGQDNPFGQPGQPGNQSGQPGNQPGQPGNQPGQFGPPGSRPGQPDQSGRPFDPNNPEMGPPDQEFPGSGPPGSRPGQGGDGVQVRMNGSITGPPYQVDRPTNGQHDGHDHNDPNGQHSLSGMGGESSTELNNFFGAENFQTTRRPGETARNQQRPPNSGNHSTVSLFLIAIMFFMLEVVRLK